MNQNFECLIGVLWHLANMSLNNVFQKDTPPGSKYAVPAAPCFKLGPEMLSQ
jgi:hypothetical protein